MALSGQNFSPSASFDNGPTILRSAGSAERRWKDVRLSTELLGIFQVAK